jgi:hypothetical protein
LASAADRDLASLDSAEGDLREGLDRCLVG